jgi:hypothetical protein
VGWTAIYTVTIVKNSRTKSEIIACTADDTNYTVYTCPANAKAHMNLLFITNGSVNDSDVLIRWYRASKDTKFFILGTRNLGGGEFIQFDGGAFIVLEPGDYIEARPFNTAGGNDPVIDVFCTVEEFFIPVGG